jgi:hypothetical protein
MRVRPCSRGAARNASWPDAPRRRATCVLLGDGETLRSRLTRTRKMAAEASVIAVQVASALAAAMMRASCAATSSPKTSCCAVMVTRRSWTSASRITLRKDPGRQLVARPVPITQMPPRSSTRWPSCPTAHACSPASATVVPSSTNGCGKGTSSRKRWSAHVAAELEDATGH